LEVTHWEMALSLLVAVASATVIGWEREAKARPAGLRTHILVALASCLFTILALDLYLTHLDSHPTATPDPHRVIAGVVNGAGFLGAGAIIQSRGTVRGFTTAAGIWVVAAIGVAAALRSYVAVVYAVALALLTLSVLAKLESKVFGGTKEKPDSDAADPASER
jgi:putative Mg2+ transporter-C (MgtC) family protein